MACFLVPAAEAVVTTITAKALERSDAKTPEASEQPRRAPLARKLRWLSNLLWGGSALLAFEHLWHGELIPAFPFLSAAANPADLAEMLREMASTGSTMALAVTAAWLGVVLVTGRWERGASSQTAGDRG